MFIRDVNSQESLIHVCDGLTEKQMRSKALEIRLHDVHIFAIIDGKMDHIKHCPYCGCNLETDAFGN